MSAQRPARGGQPAEREWLTLGQAARFLGVAQSTVRKWSDEGRLPAFYTPGGHRRFRRAELERFVGRSGPARRGGPLVLVVDDDPSVRGLLRAQLELGGYTVVEAESGERALAAISDQPPDLVLLDLVIPGVEGWQLLRELQERHGAVPVVIFSGQVDDGAAAEAAHEGAQAFVGQPFDPGELLARAAQLVPA
jgi:excisionase family DNA binding protein